MKTTTGRMLCAALSLLLLFTSSAFCASAKETKLQFHQDGTFRLLLLNDFQDDDDINEKSLVFLNVVLDSYKPDLVVLNGDQLWPDDNMTVQQIKNTLRRELSPMEKRKIPFLFTFGNHDHDHDATLDRAAQAAIYDSCKMCFASHNGPDAGTYNNVVYAPDGVTPALNIYMMDSNEWSGNYMNSGINEAQLQWYRETSSALKAANGSKAVPSLVFQHIPVKEMLWFLKEVPADTEGAVNSLFGPGKYILDPDADLIGDKNDLKEPISCENPRKTTGQYEAWVEQGDIIGAYFAHDHTNTFVGRTADGIVMGYNGGFGFATYGDGEERYARIFDFDENDVVHYTQTTLYYSKVMDKNKIRSFWQKICVAFEKAWNTVLDFFKRMFRVQDA